MASELWARLLGEAWAALGGEGPGTELQVTGVRGSLPSHLPVEDTAIACAGAALLAAADLQARRGGPVARTVRLDRGHVAAAFTLGSAEGPVTVVRPLGQLDGLELAWPSPLTRYGGDPPAWR